MGLRGRLRKLEEAPKAKQCPECKLPPEGPGYIVHDDKAGEEKKQEYCPRCGRPLYFIITVAYGA